MHFLKTHKRHLGIPFKKVFNEASQAVRIFFYDPVGNAIELNQENNTLNLFSLAASEIEEIKVQQETQTNFSQESQPNSETISQSELPSGSLSESNSESQSKAPIGTSSDSETTALQPPMQEIQMSTMANSIAEENSQTNVGISALDEPVNEAVDETKAQSFYIEQSEDTQLAGDNLTETQTIVAYSVESEETKSVKSLLDTNTVDIQSTPLKPEAIMNEAEVAYKCGPEDKVESDAPKSMTNMQKILFGTILLAVYLI